MYGIYINHKSSSNFSPSGRITVGVLTWKINCNWPACNYAQLVEHILEGGGEIGAVFFDLGKAFDSIPHEATRKVRKDWIE